MRIVTQFEQSEICLNQRLIEQQKLTQSDVDDVLATHIQKRKIFYKMKSLSPVADKFTLRFLALTVELIEYKAQEKWKFEKNSNMHRWFDVPHCSCPKSDNAERLGTPYKVINTTCPIHGNT